MFVNAKPGLNFWVIIILAQQISGHHTPGIVQPEVSNHHLESNEL